MSKITFTIIGAGVGVIAAVIDAWLITTAPPIGSAETVGFCLPWAFIGAMIGYFAGRKAHRAKQ